MDVIRKDFKYKVIKNFLTDKEWNLMYGYCRLRHTNNRDKFAAPDEIPTADTSFYGDPLMESLMILKKQEMEKLTGKELFPTYSFWRMYTHGAILPKHSDRPSCEISVTVNIFGDKDWPIFMDGTPLILKPGDACIYLGQEVEHLRDEYEGDHQAQVFLHYVDKNGKNAEWNLDKREHIAISERIKNAI